MKVIQKLFISFLFVIYSNGFAQALPSGPYLSSCTNPRMDGGTLIAVCAGAPPYIDSTLLNADQCRDPIQNINGRLVCASTQNHALFARFPQNCTDVTFDGSILSARCSVPGLPPYWLMHAQLNLTQCSGFSMNLPLIIFNEGGQLACE